MIRFSVVCSLMVWCGVSYGTSFNCGDEGALFVEVVDQSVSSAILGTGETMSSPLPLEETLKGAVYEFLVDTSYDSKVWYVITVKDSHIVDGEIWMGGNDSDDYFGKKINTPLPCEKL
ncbi:MAG: hypothetical protein K2Q26_08855 [Bdellovibrionales bacterium]|nr:hypothetical protein [Bdellovibrionales bacterium]